MNIPGLTLKLSVARLRLHSITYKNMKFYSVTILREISLRNYLKKKELRDGSFGERTEMEGEVIMVAIGQCEDYISKKEGSLGRPIRAARAVVYTSPDTYAYC
jgi:hypothetical protein